MTKILNREERDMETGQHAPVRKPLPEVLNEIENRIKSQRDLAERWSGRDREAGWAEGARWVRDCLGDYLCDELVGYGVRVGDTWECGALDEGNRRLPMNMPLVFAQLCVSMYKDEGKRVTLHRLFAGAPIAEDV